MEYCDKCGYIISQCECEKPKTNADRIRSMSDEELARIIMCPYDTYGKELPCAKDGIQTMVPPEDCNKCCIRWLQSEVEEWRWND